MNPRSLGEFTLETHSRGRADGNDPHRLTVGQLAQAMVPARWPVSPVGNQVTIR